MEPDNNRLLCSQMIFLPTRRVEKDILAAIPVLAKTNPTMYTYRSQY